MIWQCVKELHKKTVDSTLRNTKKMLKRLHGHLIFSLENLGVLGALQVFSQFLLFPPRPFSQALIFHDSWVLNIESENLLCSNLLFYTASLPHPHQANSINGLFTQVQFRMHAIVSKFEQTPWRSAKLEQECADGFEKFVHFIFWLFKVVYIESATS